jgi:hypothetical protein
MPKKSDMVWSGVIVVAVFGAFALINSGGDSPANTSSDSTPAASSSAPPPPATPAEYQAALTGFDNAVRPALDQVHAAGTDAEFTAARGNLATVLKAESDRLGAISPPDVASVGHGRLVMGLSNAVDTVRGITIDSGPPTDSCGNPVPTLPKAKVGVDGRMRTLQTDYFKPLAVLSYQVGAYVPPAPVEDTGPGRQAGNGEVVLRNGPWGPGTLDITNGTSGDVAVSVVSGSPSDPQVMVYVQAQSSASVSGISGSYEVYFKSGSDWDDQRRGFTRGCSFEKFDDPFDGESDWSIDLQATPAGNASTSSVPAF